MKRGQKADFDAGVLLFNCLYKSKPFIVCILVSIIISGSELWILTTFNQIRFDVDNWQLMEEGRVNNQSNS